MTTPPSCCVKAGSSDITPNAPLPLFGRIGRSNSSQAIRSRLEANYILFSGISEQTSALVAIDSLYPSQLLVDEIIKRSAKLGLSFDTTSLVVVASHTHNAPALDPSKFKLGKCIPEYVTFVADQIATGLARANEEKMGVITAFRQGTARSTFSVFRRRMTRGLDIARLSISRRMIMAPDAKQPIDDRLKLIILSDAHDRPSAVLWSLPCHAVSESHIQDISSDYPGVIRDYVRSKLGDASLPVLYMPGFSGDIRPALKSKWPLHRSRSWVGLAYSFARRDNTQIKSLISKLAVTFDQAWTNAQINKPINCSDIQLTRKRRYLKLAEIRTDAEMLPSLTCDEWRFGPVRIKAVSAEIASSYTNLVKESDGFTFLTGCSGQVFGYIPTDQQIKEGGYEVDGFASAFSVQGIFCATIESKICGLIGSD